MSTQDADFSNQSTRQPPHQRILASLRALVEEWREESRADRDRIYNRQTWTVAAAAIERDRCAEKLEAVLRAYTAQEKQP